MRKLTLILFFACAASGQISPRPPDAIIPVVGSTHGQSNANFKTELQMANGTDVAMVGWLVLRPQGVFRRYDLAPHTTLSFADVVADLGATGLGSIDVLVDNGLVPAIVARAYDDQPGGTTGVNVPAVPIASVLAGVDVATLIVPRDLGRYRFNIGVRAMNGGATLAVLVRSSAGVERHRRTVTFEHDQFEQQPAAVFTAATLQADDSIEIRVVAGSAIVYATTVDNQTNDSSLQIAQ